MYVIQGTTVSDDHYNLWSTWPSTSPKQSPVSCSEGTAGPSSSLWVVDGAIKGGKQLRIALVPGRKVKIFNFCEKSCLGVEVGLLSLSLYSKQKLFIFKYEVSRFFLPWTHLTVTKLLHSIRIERYNSVLSQTNNDILVCIGDISFACVNK